MPRTAVIIVNHNGGEFLLQTVNSLHTCLRQDDEIIIVDNASRDGSADAVSKACPHVAVLRNADNIGFAAANNQAAVRTQAPYLAFLNPDALAGPDWLAPLINALRGDPRIGMATSKILLHDQPEKINACGNTIHFTGLTLCRGMGQDKHLHGHGSEVNAVSGAAFAMSRELFFRLGGFDEDFFLYMEDTDLSLRCRIAGFSCVCVPESIAYHQYRLRFGPKKIFHQERNRYRMLLKCHRWTTLAALTPGLVLAEVVTWGFVLFHQPRSVLDKIRAYSRALSKWSALMGKRKHVQSLRTVQDREIIAQHAHALDFYQTGSGLAATAATHLINPIFLLMKKIVSTLVR